MRAPHELSAHERLQFGTWQALWLALPPAIGLWRIARGDIGS